jgi:hypothetical protein
MTELLPLFQKKTMTNNCTTVPVTLLQNTTNITIGQAGDGARAAADQPRRAIL